MSSGHFTKITAYITLFREKNNLYGISGIKRGDPTANIAAVPLFFHMILLFHSALSCHDRKDSKSRARDDIHKSRKKCSRFYQPARFQ